MPSARAASFPGNARVEINDPNGGLSWSNSVNALTVQCWFKLAIPSGASLTENMTILVNRRTGTTSNPHAYHFWYDKTAKNIQFSTRGTSLWQGVLIPKPYLDRWYHLAVVRSGGSLAAYVDGQAVTNVSITVGDSRSADGVSIGGWANANYLYGEVQELTIYHRALGVDLIRDRMFRDQTNQLDLVGYYKLGYSANAADFYRNFATTLPLGTDPGVKAGSGQFLFEETDRKGEQSLFDSQVSGGKNAVVPLSGAFTWQQSVFNRPVPGVPFDLSIAYSPGASSALGPGWSHSFDTKASAESLNLLKVITWQGGIETWETTNAVAFAPWSTRHGEYRGELTQDAGGDVLWTNAQARIHRFRNPGGVSLLKGTLAEIRDLNGNSMQLQWDANEKRITNVVDSPGGNYRFYYNPQNLLTNVSFGDWQVRFSYTNQTVFGQPQNLLAAKTLTNTSGLYTNVNTALRFYYNTNGLLERIEDPRGNTNVIVRYDDYGRQIETVNALGCSTRREYGVPDKRQITTTDPAGFKWIETCDRKGRTIAQRNPLGHETRFTYDDHGNRISTTDPLGNTSWFAYDERANLIAQTNALGEVSRRTYHPVFNKPLTQSDPLGWVTTNTYDSNGNLLSQSDALGTLAAYTYTPEGLVETRTDANGNTNRFAHNADGFRVAETDAAGFTTRFLPNELGWNLAVTNALGEVTTYAYDLNSNIVQTLDPLTRVYNAAYDANGNRLARSDAKGQVTLWTHDALNRLTAEVNRSGATNRFAYTLRGKPAFATNALGQVTALHYDAANRQSEIVDALGNSVDWVYDANDNVIALVDPTGQRWTRIYDRLNRVVAKTDPLGNTTRTLYDPAGRAQATIAADGFATTFWYDGRGRMTNLVDAAGSVWRYDYDAVGNITNITDALTNHYVMAYGPRNERILERNQDGKEWRYTYDALKRLKTQTDPNGTVRVVEYDAGGRVASATFNTGRINSFLYDDNNNPVVLSRAGSGPATLTLLAYDAMDRVQQYTDAFSKTVRYTRDPAGRLTSVTYPDGKVLTNRYDKMDRLTNQVFQFSAGQTFATSYAYDGAGHLIRRTYPNGIVQTNTFDGAGRLTGLSHAPPNPQPSALKIALGYAYDRIGNTTLASQEGVFPWPTPPPRQEQARYTPGARLMDRDIRVTNQTSLITYRYDSSGNLTNAIGNGQSWSLAYDEENRATAVHWDSGVTGKTTANRYDALGRRIACTEDGSQTAYVLDLAGRMERILCDLDAGRAITAWYVHGPDLAFKVAPDGSLTCFHADAQGNIIALTDGQTNTVAQYAYTPYGRRLGATNSPPQVSNPYAFVGNQGVMQEVLPEGIGDELGLSFMRARYYSANAGVFLSPDPVRNIEPGWKPIPYAYANGNPLKFRDPKGEQDEYGGIPEIWTKEYWVDLWRDLKALFDPQTWKDLYEEAKETVLNPDWWWEDVILPTRDVAVDAWNFGKQAWEYVSSGEILTDISNWGKQVWSDVSTWAQDAWSDVSTWAQETWSDVKTTAQEAWSDIKSGATKAWNWLFG